MYACKQSSNGGTRAILDIHARTGEGAEALVVGAAVARPVLTHNFENVEGVSHDYPLEVDGKVEIVEGGHTGRAARFGVGGSLLFDPQAAFAMTEGLEVDVWLLVETSSPTMTLIKAPGAYDLVLAKDVRAEAYDVVLALYLKDSSDTGRSYAARTEFRTKGAPLDPGRGWTHVEASFDGRTASIRVDGIECLPAVRQPRPGEAEVPEAAVRRIAVPAGGAVSLSISEPNAPFEGLLDNLVLSGVFRTQDTERDLYGLELLRPRLPVRVVYRNGRLDPQEHADDVVLVFGEAANPTGPAWEVRLGLHGTVGADDRGRPSMTTSPPPARPRGFTMLELILAMALFVFLGTVVVVLMRQGMSIFVAGAKDSALQDRMETVLPGISRTLQLLTLPLLRPPSAAPHRGGEARRAGGGPAAPPVRVRLRAGTILLRDVPDGPLRDQACPYAAWVVDLSGNRGDPVIRRAGERSGPDLKDVVPAEVDKAGPETAFLPTGGLREVCYVAVPEDPDFPALLTLYFGWRSPVGGERSLLDPQNLDTLVRIREACRPVARGLIHFQIVWRRVFAPTWDPTTGAVGETDPCVGVTWDSTRALDRTFGLFRGPESLGDPSDDVFPAWARLEVTLVVPGPTGLGRGDTALTEFVTNEDHRLLVEDAVPLLGPGPDERYLKVGAEWMRYRVGKVNARTGEVPVERGQRGTTPTSHDVDADVYVGIASREDVRLLYRDRYARERRRP